ncbi:site-2 protease family protein [Dasania marina]|uniref:site-2 protease family protein n=1 Tax=Dasania marina TaxID=471499 RepID=UPI000360A7E5|nr:site-2 protease family protein [Dasania marina]
MNSGKIIALKITLREIPLLKLELFGKTLKLENDGAGTQCLYWADELVSKVELSGVTASEIVHRFLLQQPNNSVEISLNLQAKDQTVAYQLWVDQHQQETGEFLLTASAYLAKEKSTHSFMGLAALAFKLFKSAKVIKVALAGASVAGYAWLFTVEFALVIVACLVVHEYGHVRAMQYFGIKTKGIYLIPFVGGLAVSDDKINTRWQDVVISIMGPCFGLFMSLACLIIYWVTDIELFAGAAVLSALLNLFNLLPILPLDGGHVLKSISFSMHSWAGLSVCMAGIGLGLLLAYIFGLALLVFFLFVGAIEVIFEWRQRHFSHLIPLDRYGQIFSAVSYFLVTAGHIAVIISFADSENPILSLPMKIFSS